MYFLLHGWFTPTELRRHCQIITLYWVCFVNLCRNESVKTVQGTGTTSFCRPTLSYISVCWLLASYLVYKQYKQCESNFSSNFQPIIWDKHSWKCRNFSLSETYLYDLSWYQHRNNYVFESIYFHRIISFYFSPDTQQTAVRVSS